MSDDVGNSIDEVDSLKLPAAAKQDTGLVSTVVDLALKFVPLLIGAISGETGPSQTDRIEGIDLNVSTNSIWVIACWQTNSIQGEDPFSWRNVALIGLKLFLAIAGGQTANEKSDNPIEVSVDNMSASNR